MENNNTSSIRASLVGAHFRPPAKQVLSALAAATPLTLVPEPENPYDAKAIAVFWQSADADPDTQARVIDAMAGTGAEFAELGLLQLGYVADSDGKACKQYGFPGNREIAIAVEAKRTHAAVREDGESDERYNSRQELVDLAVGVWPAQARLAFDAKGFPQVVVA